MENEPKSEMGSTAILDFKIVLTNLNIQVID